MSKQILSLLCFDWITKYIILFYIPYKRYDLTENISLSIIHVWNYGISFGLFASVSTYIFIINTIIISYFYIKMKNRLQIWNICILAGGICNIIDRLVFGAVFDYIMIIIHDYTFPVFNFADTIISLGVLIALVENISIRKEKK